MLISTTMMSDDEYPMVAVHASWFDHVYVCGCKVISNQNSNVASSKLIILINLGLSLNYHGI